MSDRLQLGLCRDLFDENGTLIFSDSGLDLLDDLSDLEYRIFPQFLPEITPGQIQGCDVVITAKAGWTARSLAGNEQLVAVLFTGVGYDHIDVAALNEAGVMLCFSPDAVRRPMAVAIITFILALAMRVVDKDRLVREGKWTEREGYHGTGLTGKTLGSLGVGNIGREMFELAAPFGMHHIAYDPFLAPEAVTDTGVRLVDMETVFRESDFLSISMPLNEQTRHLIGEDELKKMKDTAYLINTSRGAIVDEAALITALREGWIRGAGLDVFEEEPVPPENPLLQMANVVVAPHCLGHTDEFFTVSWEQKVRQATQILHGENPEALVNRQVLENPALQDRLRRFADRYAQAEMI